MAGTNFCPLPAGNSRDQNVAMERAENHRPGDIILNRYLPDATEREREEARGNLYEFVDALYRIALRIAQEEHDTVIRAKKESPVSLDGTSSPMV